MDSMTADFPCQGSLFTSGFLVDTIREMPDWQLLPDAEIRGIDAKIQTLLDRFVLIGNPNEVITTETFIKPVLEILGWKRSLAEINMSPQGRIDVPDHLLFAADDAYDQAIRHDEEWRRYNHGAALLEAKRWGVLLDRRDGDAGQGSIPPSSQMLRYMRRADDVTEGRLRWGILTNGRHWRLYWSGARSVSEGFLEIDLDATLRLETEDRQHWLKVFFLAFRPEAFCPSDAAGRSFHLQAIEEGRSYEARIADDLSIKVFESIFPRLAAAIAAERQDASLEDIREGTLIILYRLLFLLYAEDRNLLPVRDPNYAYYSLRRMRHRIGEAMVSGQIWSQAVTALWHGLDGLFRAVGEGDPDLGIPPYNGGLFEQIDCLNGLSLSDAVVAPLIDILSFDQAKGERKYINYRDLSVQQLGSVYERILEYDVVRDNGEIGISPNPYARKTSGSFYTPDELVHCVLKETLEPLIDRCWDPFLDRITSPETVISPPEIKITPETIRPFDPAGRMLDLRICDPAMGSGHFLVTLVDSLADRVIAAMAEAAGYAEQVGCEYTSPLTSRIAGIRKTILDNAATHGWTLDESLLDDRHIVRRMVLKRCVYGADKNPMAVELAKVSLWLHSFTVGAPLSFLDHHLRCGDSLFGSWLSIGDLNDIFLAKPLQAALRSARRMERIELLTDAEIAEAQQSAALYADMIDMTGHLNAFLALRCALAWLNPNREQMKAVGNFLSGIYGDPVGIAYGADPTLSGGHDNGNDQAAFETFCGILGDARDLIARERFISWQVSIPGIWTDWGNPERQGGFDAVIGNPPWDRMKLQEVEWFAERSPEIAHAPTAAERRRLIAELPEDDPLRIAFDAASKRAQASMSLARKGGDYPLLAHGDINLYALFVERALALIRPEGLVGLVIPSGIATDRTAARFFRGISTTGRLRTFYDFENGRRGADGGPFFKDVDSRFKFCILVAGREDGAFDHTRCAAFVHDIADLASEERCFDLGPDDFAGVNPNTGTAPLFRTRRDADLTRDVYQRLPVLVNRSGRQPEMTWPLRMRRMFDMTNDSHHFRTRLQLEEEMGAWPIGANIHESPEGRWVPLYVGRMIHQFDHRASGVTLNPENLHNPYLSDPSTPEQKSDPAFLPAPQYWVQEAAIGLPEHISWVIGFRDITNTTNARTVIASAVPRAGFGNTAPILLPDGEVDGPLMTCALLLANMNALPFDYIARQKVQSTHLNWYILEQLPVVPREQYETARFGPKSAAEIVGDIVLELTYTSHDMAGFARDMGHLDANGEVRPPFVWDEGRRLRLRARLDALYFHLYGITERDDVRYIYETFPIIAEDEKGTYGCYRSLDLCLAWINALAAGTPDADIA